jgi:hypothetical protein
MPRADVDTWARAVADTELTPYLSAADGLQVAQWLSALRTQLEARATSVAAGAQLAAYRWAYAWHHGLLERTVDVVGQAIALHGLPYASELLVRLRAHIEMSIAPSVQDLARHAGPDSTVLPAGVESSVGAMRGVIAAGREVMNTVMQGLRSQVGGQINTIGAGLLRQALDSYVVDVLAPLGEAIAEAQRLLEQARLQVEPDLGRARLGTSFYSAWPSDQDVRVPTRFSHADNEVLLMSSELFGEQYEKDIRGADEQPQGGRRARFEDARDVVVTQVIAGSWATTGAASATSAVELVEQTSAWRSRVFSTDPETGAPTVPSMARFDIHVRPPELLARTRAFIGRPDASFSRFTRVSLRGYVSGADTVESEREGRAKEIVAKFREALALARPLAAVNPDAVMALHNGTPLAYRYKFSESPFADLDGDVARALRTVLVETANLDESSVGNFDTALLNADDRVMRIDIFGSYQNYSPLAFEGVLRPVAEQWGQTPPQGRADFWRWRRARPLDAALPMAAVERRAMVAGWFVAQITGDLRIPSPESDEPIGIWDPEAGAWLTFPHPLLTPPRSADFTVYDLLPAVLESVLLAYARAHEAPVMASLRPYQVLRRAYDSAPAAPTSGVIERAGKVRLKNWLESGRTASGGKSRVPGIAEATTSELRAILVRTWLTDLRGMAEQFMAPGQDGVAGGGDFSSITTREQAARTPIFRDLAPDVRWACTEIVALLDERGPQGFIF